MSLSALCFPAPPLELAAALLLLDQALLICTRRLVRIVRDMLGEFGTWTQHYSNLRRFKIIK